MKNFLLFLIVLTTSDLIHAAVPEAPDSKPRSIEARKYESLRMQQKNIACFNLVKAVYDNDHDAISTFIQSHPTVSKERLTNKILANLMIACTDNITEAEVQLLHVYKSNPEMIDVRTYAPLVDFDYSVLAVNKSLSFNSQRLPI